MNFEANMLRTPFLEDYRDEMKILSKIPSAAHGMGV